MEVADQQPHRVDLKKPWPAICKAAGATGLWQVADDRQAARGTRRSRRRTATPMPIKTLVEMTGLDISINKRAISL
jgi:hypothetical protein